MSEYQYYEFRAIDLPLDEKAIQSLRNLSSRAQITPTSFVNEYNWGDFKGSPLKLVEEYFDAFLYVANWGTHHFMLRVPLKLINFGLAKQYCYGENVTGYKKGENLIFEFISETDDHEWEEGEDWLSSLITLRSDILQGDYRCLYLGWLFCAQMGDFEDDEFEPPVPPHLRNLNGPLKSFVDFMRIDTDLVAVAAENSASKDLHQAVDQKELGAWISNLPEKEKDDILLRLIKGHDPHLGAELVQRYQQSFSIKDNGGMGMKPRIVEDLISKGQAYAAERKRRIAEQAARERARKERERTIIREKYLNELAKRGDQVWKQVDELIKTKRPSDYDSAVQLLVDLRDLSIKINKDRLFQEKLRSLREKHNRKPSFVRRLNEAGLDGQAVNS
ncbi:MAG: hypothetical protein ISS63_13015 [Desulfobacteraceae bacterium]|nr:hypothetical protein [Desulfobacteraceae bacterium]